ncbi:hypothetical protein ACLOJK_033487 [Asimina triloba]
MFLDDTVDLIGQASSNPLLIFCLCNFIIAILFISGFRSDSPSQDQYSCNFRQLAAAAPTPAQERIEVGDETKEEDGSNDQQNHSNDGDHGDHNNSNNYNYEEDKDDDDELRMRVEEFIEKINRRWQEEKMMQGCLSSLATAV